MAQQQISEKNLLDFDDLVSKYIPIFKNLMCKSKEGIVPCKNEIKIIDQMTLRINDLLTGMFRAIGIKLVDFKVDLEDIRVTVKLKLY